MPRPGQALQPAILSASAAKLAALTAALVGFGLVLMVGFAHPMALHNAAHDSRHSFAFPCH